MTAKTQQNANFDFAMHREREGSAAEVLSVLVGRLVAATERFVAVVVRQRKLPATGDLHTLLVHVPAAST